MVNLFINNLASLLASQMLKFHKEDTVYTYKNLHYAIASVCLLTMIAVAFRMKEIVIQKSSPEVEKPKLKKVLGSALKAILKDGEIVLGMSGALIQVLIGMIGSSITTLAVLYNFKKICEDQSEESICVKQATENTQDYIADLQIKKTVITLPCMICFGILLNYVDAFKFLATTCFLMIAAGSVMTM